MVLEDVYKFKPHVNAGDQKIAAMAILGLIITKQMVEYKFNLDPICI